MRSGRATRTGRGGDAAGRSQAKRVRPSTPRLSGEEREAVRSARAAGLYVLVDGPVGGRKWVVYNPRTGAEVVTFCPRTHAYRGRLSGLAGGHADWPGVLRLAAAATAA